MANPTARELIIDAYIASGVRSPNQLPNAQETALGLRYLNFDIIDQLRIQKLWSGYTKIYTFNTESNKQYYSIGEADPVPSNPQPDIVVSQDIIQIESAQVNISSVWSNLDVISEQDFYSIEQTTSSTVPTALMYNKTQDPFDTIALIQPSAGIYPIRLACNGIVLNYGLDDEIDLKSGYYSALKSGLSYMLAKVNGLDTWIDLKQDYADNLNRLKDVNASPTPMLKLQQANSQYNIFSDTIVGSLQ